MNKKVKVAILLCAVVVCQSVTAFADSFSTASSTNYHWEGSNVASNPWSGNPYAKIRHKYMGKDSTDTVTFATEALISGKTGNSLRINGNGSDTLYASSYFSAATASFDSLHCIKIKGKYERKRLSSQP